MHDRVLVVIIADTHEPREIVEKLKAKTEYLVAGDYHITGQKGNVAIERKTLDDFVSSIRDGRLWQQLALLKHLVDYQPLLLLEGETWRVFKFRKVTLPQWYGMLQAVSVGYGIPIIQTRNVDQTVLFIRTLHDRLGEAKTYYKPTVKKGEREPIEQAEDMLVAIDGFGRVKAREVLKHYSIRDIVMNPHLLMKVRGVGQKLYDNFVAVINAKL